MELLTQVWALHLGPESDLKALFRIDWEKWGWGGELVYML